MRVGLFGGTFNPVHLGHIQVAKEIKKKHDLDQLYLIPSAIPPHKKKQGIADAQDRLNMIRLAVSNMDGFLVSDVELARSGPSYTIDTINHFRDAFPESTKIYLILGMDAFLEIDTWMSYDKLFQRLPLIIMSRPGTEHITIEQLTTYIQDKLSKDYRFQKNKNRFVHHTNQSINFVTVTPYDISSSKIRKLIVQKKPVLDLIPEKIERYIKEKGLYA